jgi:hypothetical protein
VAIGLLKQALIVLQDQLAPDHPHLVRARENLESAILSSRSEGSWVAADGTIHQLPYVPQATGKAIVSARNYSGEQ